MDCQLNVLGKFQEKLLEESFWKFLKESPQDFLAEYLPEIFICRNLPGDAGSVPVAALFRKEGKMQKEMYFIINNNLVEHMQIPKKTLDKVYPPETLSIDGAQILHSFSEPQIGLESSELI